MPHCEFSLLHLDYGNYAHIFLRVLYCFRTKDAVMDAAYQFVLTALVDDVAGAVESVDAQNGPQAYVRSMIGHVREHPRRTRMMIVALGNPAPGRKPHRKLESIDRKSGH
ncbi:hypothetical protein [Rhodococcus sovatensis]|uniref:Uncharacterized protein n=1 Tax=Rhodococcus sovatensis TaxID=1805840 RepID=A0ABZ2PFX9_9NOCA